MTTTWDYSGIVAAAYDLYFGAEPFWDQRFFEQKLRANGGRALEIACGTGRLLLPFLRDGLEVEGLDRSLVAHERTAYEDGGRTQHWMLRYAVERPGQPDEVFFREHRLRHYDADEFRELLAAAGFEGIAVRRGYTELQSSDPDENLVFSARRPHGR